MKAQDENSLENLKEAIEETLLKYMKEGYTIYFEEIDKVMYLRKSDETEPTDATDE